MADRLYRDAYTGEMTDTEVAGLLVPLYRQTDNATTVAQLLRRVADLERRGA